GRSILSGFNSSDVVGALRSVHIETVWPLRVKKCKILIIPRPVVFANDLNGVFLKRREPLIHIMFGQHHASVAVNPEVFGINTTRINTVIPQKLCGYLENAGLVYLYFIESPGFQRIVRRPEFWGASCFSL